METAAELAVSVTFCAVATEETVAGNPTLVAFAGTITEVGTVTAELLLDRFTVSPPVGAAEVSVTAQASVPDPVIDPLLQVSVLRAAAGALAVPVPLKAIVAVEPDDELLVMVSSPAAAPAVAGSNPRFKVSV